MYVPWLSSLANLRAALKGKHLGREVQSERGLPQSGNLASITSGNLKAKQNRTEVVIITASRLASRITLDNVVAEGSKRAGQTGEPVQLIAILRSTNGELGNLGRSHSVRKLSHILVFPLLSSEVPYHTLCNGGKIHAIKRSIGLSDFIIHGVQIGTLGNPVGQNHIADSFDTFQQVLHPAMTHGIIQVRNQRELEVEKPLTHSGVSMGVKRRSEVRMRGIVGRGKFRRLAITKPAFEIRHTATGKINNCHSHLLLS
nr:MAG TPA: hypothetical protein [Caudoviricetes sp.]